MDIHSSSVLTREMDNFVLVDPSRYLRTSTRQIQSVGQNILISRVAIARCVPEIEILTWSVGPELSSDDYLLLSWPCCHVYIQNIRT